VLFEKSNFDTIHTGKADPSRYLIIGFDTEYQRYADDDVRRQGFWNQRRPKLRESLAHLVCLIMRRAVCDASAALRVSFV